MSNFNTLSDRMKCYESVNSNHLTRRTPVIMRLDGQCFKNYTSNFNKPFDVRIVNAMYETTLKLMHTLQGSKMAYIQSDEVSILISDYDSIDTEPWFSYNIQKMVTSASSLFSVYFNKNIELNSPGLKNIKPATFDSRVFNIPEDDVNNYFIWRQSDWKRNSLSSLARKYYSQNELNGKNYVDLHEMIHLAGDNWANLDPVLKNGRFIFIKDDYTYSDDIVFQQDGRILVDEILSKIRLD